MRELVKKYALIAAKGRKDEIETELVQLRRTFPELWTGTAQVAPKRRAMSAAARRRIGIAQKKRWAAMKAEKGAKTLAKTPAKK